MKWSDPPKQRQQPKDATEDFEQFVSERVDKIRDLLDEVAIEADRLREHADESWVWSAPSDSERAEVLEHTAKDRLMRTLESVSDRCRHGASKRLDMVERDAGKVNGKTYKVRASTLLQVARKHDDAMRAAQAMRDYCERVNLVTPIEIRATCDKAVEVGIPSQFRDDVSVYEFWLGMDGEWRKRGRERPTNRTTSTPSGPTNSRGSSSCCSS